MKYDGILEKLASLFRRMLIFLYMPWQPLSEFIFPFQQEALNSAFLSLLWWMYAFSDLWEPSHCPLPLSFHSILQALVTCSFDVRLYGIGAPACHFEADSLCLRSVHYLLSLLWYLLQLTKSSAANYRKSNKQRLNEKTLIVCVRGP